MNPPRIAVVSFPGNNCEVESMRAIKKAGMEAMYFRWNDDRAKLVDVDGYFIPGGFSYEDRGRSGMVAGRDPLMDFIGQEAEAGKAVIGNCNGAQILVESGLIPLGKGLLMSLARNVITDKNDAPVAPGFLSEWVWIMPSDKERCATSFWDGPMQLPIAHGEGRFVTKDHDLFSEMEKNGQIGFYYCDANGRRAYDNAELTPNGSTLAAAGICNPAGNVVALMPHPERTPSGGDYFKSLHRWILNRKALTVAAPASRLVQPWMIKDRTTPLAELFIDTIITNNEERTIEQTARRLLPALRLKQWKYLSMPERELPRALSDLTVFNPHKERAFIRRGSAVTRWNADQKKEEACHAALFGAITLYRRDIPDTGTGTFGEGSQTGICYSCDAVAEGEVLQRPVLEVFANPHASTLERLRA